MSTKNEKKTKVPRFTKSEEKFLSQNEVCRISTSHNDIPHVTPVTYIYENDFLYFATSGLIEMSP